jgi:hypothetical protein
VNTLQEEAAALVRELFAEAARTDAGRLLRWPGDTQFDGGQAEALAAAMDAEAETKRDVARRLAALLEPEF